MKQRSTLTPDAVRAHGRTVCSDSVIHACRICGLLNRMFLDEVRLSVGLERMPRGRRCNGETPPGPRVFMQSVAWSSRLDGRVSVFTHD